MDGDAAGLDSAAPIFWGVWGTPSLDDLVLLTELRAVTVVRGLRLPPRVEAYLTHWAGMCGLALHDELAIA